MSVVETFFSLEVDDMARATAFYVGALAATVTYSSPQWTSLHLAGVRIGLFARPGHIRGRTGIHFVVESLPAACAAIEDAGGTVAASPTEVAPDVVIAEAIDTEGNTFTLRRL